LGAVKEVNGSAIRPPNGRRCAPSFFVVAKATTHKAFVTARLGGGSAVAVIAMVVPRCGIAAARLFVAKD
jgi:uncharacterized membrane protein